MSPPPNIYECLIIGLLPFPVVLPVPPNLTQPNTPALCSRNAEVQCKNNIRKKIGFTLEEARVEQALALDVYVHLSTRMYIPVLLGLN